MTMDDLALALFEAVASLRGAIRRAARQRLPEGTVSTAEAQLLVAVTRSPGMSVTEAAEVLALAPNTVSTLVGRLSRAGLVDRRRGNGDRRTVSLAATAAGLAAISTWRGERARVVAEALASLDPGEVEAIEAVLGPLARLAGALRSEGRR